MLPAFLIWLFGLFPCRVYMLGPDELHPAPLKYETLLD